MLSFARMESTMSKARKKNGFPNVPENLEDFIQSINGNKDKFDNVYGESFFSGLIGRGDEVAVVFLVKQLQGLLAESEEIHFDGTFKCVPKKPKIYQLFTIMAIYSDHSIYRKVQQLGISTIYKDNSYVKKGVLMMMATALLPYEKIDEGYFTIQTFFEMQAKPQLSQQEFMKIESLLSYFKTQWIETVGSKSFSVFGQTNRTNNSQESFHSKLNSLIGTAHPNIWSFLRGCSSFGHSCFGGHGKRSEDFPPPDYQADQELSDPALPDKLPENYRQTDIVPLLRQWLQLQSYRRMAESTTK